MNNRDLSSTLADADQPVREFMATLYETFSSQLAKQDEPSVKFEYFGAVMEVRLLSFAGEASQTRQKKADLNL